MQTSLPGLSAPTLPALPSSFQVYKRKRNPRNEGITSLSCLPGRLLSVALAVTPALRPFPGLSLPVALPVVLPVLQGAVQAPLQLHPILSFFKKDRCPSAHATEGGAGGGVRRRQGESVQAVVTQQALEGLALPLQRLLVEELPVRHHLLLQLVEGFAFVDGFERRRVLQRLQLREGRCRARGLQGGRVRGLGII